MDWTEYFCNKITKELLYPYKLKRRLLGFRRGNGRDFKCLQVAFEVQFYCCLHLYESMTNVSDQRILQKENISAGRCKEYWVLNLRKTA